MALAPVLLTSVIKQLLSKLNLKRFACIVNASNHQTEAHQKQSGKVLGNDSPMTISEIETNSCD